MTNQSTIDKLIEMRLTAMSDAFLHQLNDSKMKEISFEDRFGMLVDIEYSNRKNNNLKRLIRNAGFDQPEAYIEDINYTSGHKLNRDLIRRLATCEYITEHRNLFITGATRLTWHARLVWKLVSNATRPSMSGSRIFCLNWKYPETKVLTKRSRLSMQTRFCSLLMNGFF